MSTIQQYRLANDDLDVIIISYGAAIYQLCSKNKASILTNNVLRYQSIDDYIYRNGNYLGVIVGPSVGRIQDASFTLGDQLYTLDANHAGDNLHGGKAGFSRQHFRLLHHDSSSVLLTYTTAHLQNGFPGNVCVEVEYRIEANQLSINYKATSSHDTLMDISNHSYFNLNDSHDIAITNHALRIDADFFSEIDSNGIASDTLLPVAGTPLDLRKSTAIEALLQAQQQDAAEVGLDHPFLLNSCSHQASLSCAASGKIMHINTTAPAIVCYSAAQLAHTLRLANGISSQPYAGICLETQHLPNAINSCQLIKKPILLANTPFTSSTVFTFDLL
jgi:aldose 1-epimerase